MAEITLDFLGKRLDVIQAELREIKFGAEVDRRNRDSEYRNLVTEVGAALGTFEAKMENRIFEVREQLDDMADQLTEIKAILKAGRE